MGTNLPGGRRQSLEYIEGIIGQWSTNQGAIGLTSASVINLGQELTNTRASFTTVETARTDAKAKTQDFYANADEMHKSASDMIGTIKAFAASSGSSANVYLLAGLTPKDPPQPVPAPETPTALSATLATNGTVNLKWDGRGPAQTLYEIYRRLASETLFTLLSTANARDKTFNDATVPAAQTLVYYQVRAVRGETMSAFSEQTAIQFGSIAPPVAEAAA